MKRIVIAAIAPVLVLTAVQSATLGAEMMRLDKGKEFTPVDPNTDKFLLAVSEAKELVTKGEKKEAKEAYEKLKSEYPTLAGDDFDVFVKGELFYAAGKFTSAVRTFDKLLNEYRTSPLYEAALDRQFQMATAYLNGRKKVLLGFIKVSGYDEGVTMMDKIVERAGDTPVALQASVAVARHYEEREKHNEAHLRWVEIYTEWGAGPIGKEALLALARNKHAQYNKPPEKKRPFYDGSTLLSARSYYLRFKSIYPRDAAKIGVDKIVNEINEQIAFKQYTIGRYYRRTGETTAANLYFDMVVNDWPGTEAAELAAEALGQASGEKTEENG